jgi:broad specificity phosphatase PhoE
VTNVLLLVRHGETMANRQRQLLGRADPPLTETGWEQATALAAWLPRPDVLVSSPLLRARQTAGVLGSDVQLDDRWIELDYGPYDEQPASALAPEVWARWREDAHFTPPGVEPYATLASRVADACDELAAAARSSVVIVVTHVSPIKAALAWALGVTHQIAWRTFVEDASVSRIDVDATGPLVRWFNRTGGSPS